MSAVTVKEELSIVYNVYNGVAFVTTWAKDAAQLLNHGVEVIVILDEPTDNTEERIRRSLGAHKNLIIIKLDENIGAAAARNIGLFHCSRKFIMFCDFDDRIVSHNLLTFFKSFKKAESDIGIANFGWKIKDSREKPIISVDEYIPDPHFMNIALKNKGIDVLISISRWPTGHWRMCFSVEYLRSINLRWFPTYEDMGLGVRLSEDVFFIVYILVHNPKIFIWDSKDIIYVYGFSDISARSVSDPDLILEATLKFLKLFDEINCDYNKSYLTQFVINTLWDYLPRQKWKRIVHYTFVTIIVTVRLLAFEISWKVRWHIFFDVIRKLKNSLKGLIMRILRNSDLDINKDSLLFVRNYLSQ